MVVASGNKLKGITNPDVEPTLADIQAAKKQQSASSMPATPMAVSSPLATAN
jgi:hypothetical protein